MVGLRRTCSTEESLPRDLVLFAVILLSFISLSFSSIRNACPCDDPTWCQPIAGPPVAKREVFGFHQGGGKNPLPVGMDMNWTYVTTVAWAESDEMMCLAHQHGARAVIVAPTIVDMSHFVHNASARREYAVQALEVVQSRHRDGIVFDYEDALPPHSAEGLAYAKLIAKTRAIFHKANPSLQISTCIPWSPDNIDGRFYPWLELASASDILYVMDYDTRSQIFDQCIASANAPYPGMINGMEQWLGLGIPPNKLILGVPWYGYKYPCLNGTLPNDSFCPIPSVPFRGIPCSDAAGTEIPHEYAIRTLEQNKNSSNVTGGLRRDDNTGSLFFNTIEHGGQVYQYWIEDSVLLRRKYAWARQHGLAGVGPYTFDNLDPVTQADESISMWSAFDEFMLQEEVTSHAVSHDSDSSMISA